MSGKPAGPDPSRRAAGIDLLRAAITVAVVAFHSILGYVTFAFYSKENYLKSVAPVIDNQRWAGFDLFFFFNNTFFMALMFFISGLFVVPSIERKGSAAFLRDRALRLGVPFLLGILFLSPLAYYPSFLLTGQEQGYLPYWRDMVLFGPWSPGPLWFIFMLLVFNVVLLSAFKFIGKSGVAEKSRCWQLGKIRNGPNVFFLMLLGLSIVSYMALFHFYSPFLWLLVGPIAFQASRVLLYLVYFGLGAYFGAHGLSSTFLGAGSRFGNSWWVWVIFSGISFVWFLVSNKAMMDHFDPSGPWTPPAGWISTGVSFATCCATISWACLMVFHRFPIPPSRLSDSLCANAYGIYLVHYPFVIWAQYSLLEWPLGAVAKAAIVFAVSLGGSWGLVAMVRRIPTVARVI